MLMGGEVAVLLAGLVAPAHDSIREGHEWWTGWTLDLPVIVPSVVAGLLYARGLRRWPDRSREHSMWQAALYYGGLVTIVLSLVSPIDALGAHHFFMHMVQHVLFLMLGLPVVLLGAPTTPVLRGLPRWVRLGAVAGLAGDPLLRAVWRGLTQPLVAFGLFTGTLWAWHLAPGWYDAAVRDDNIHYVEHLTFGATAWLFWWNVIDPAPLRASMGYLLRIVYLIAAGTAESVLAAFITLAEKPFYAAYIEARPIVAISTIDDQQLGGLIMWVPGQLLNLAAIGVLFAVWFAQAERQQERAEAIEAAARDTHAALDAGERSGPAG